MTSRWHCNCWIELGSAIGCTIAPNKCRLANNSEWLSLGRWRQQARLLHALGLLAHGQLVTAIALDVGYDSPSAFIAAFSTAFGTTPGRYYRRRAAGA